MAVISEIKRRSPSKGDLDPDLDPAGVAADYEAAAPACLSVLTDEEFFGGSPDDLVAARGACGCRCCARTSPSAGLDVCDARLMGADAVLLIVAALDDAELAALSGRPAASGWPRWSRCTTRPSSGGPWPPGPT